MKAQPPTHALRDAFAKALDEIGLPDIAWKMDQDHLSLHCNSGGSKHSFSWKELGDSIQEMPARAFIYGLALGAQAAAKHYDDGRSYAVSAGLIVAQILPRSFSLALARASAPSPVQLPWGEQLCLYFWLEGEGRSDYIDEATAARWQASTERLRSAARSNLHFRSYGQEQTHQSLSCYQKRDELDSGRALALPDLEWSADKIWLGLPSRDLLLYTQDPAEFTTLAEATAEAFATSSSPLSPLLFEVGRHGEIQAL